MSNMSYCKFENTCNDLSDCVDYMMRAESMADLVHIESEGHAMHRMAQLCEQFLNRYMELSAYGPVID